MKSKLVKYKGELLGLALGASAGWCYWYFVGCASGSCAITSSPINSSLYGAFSGWLFAGIFRKPKIEENRKTDENY